jgi:hypothetical protein
MTTFKKPVVLSALLLVVSGVSFAAETLRLFPVYPNTLRNTVDQRGIDMPNTDFAINTAVLYVFQPCNVLQFGGFIKSGNCGTYKAKAQLWVKKPLKLVNTEALPIAVVQYPIQPITTPPKPQIAYSTPNGQPFIIGNIIRYAQQSCDPKQVDTTRYAITSEPCVGATAGIGGMRVWKRTAPLK